MAKIGAEFGLDTEVQRIENPRVEAEEHPYEVIHEKLSQQFGFASESSLEEEVRGLFKVLMTPESIERIKQQESKLFPKTRWSGEEDELKVLETWKPSQVAQDAA